MGIVSDPWDRGKGFARASDTDTSEDQERTEGQWGPLEPPEGRRRHGGTHGTGPPRRAGRRPEGYAAGDGRPHEVSRTGAGNWPGRKTATRRRCPAWHTGHRVRSTSVSRHIRTTTDSGAGGPDRQLSKTGIWGPFPRGPQPCVDIRHRGSCRRCLIARVA